MTHDGDRHAFWLSLLAGRLDSAEEAEGLEAGRRSAEAVFRDREAVGDVIDVMRRRLASPVTRDLWGDVRDALVALVGVDGGHYIMSALRPESTAGQDLAGSVAVTNGVGRLRGLFSHELEVAWSAWQEDPNDWRTANWDIFIDEFDGTTRIDFRIIKYSGITFNLLCDAESLVNLAQASLTAVSKIKSPVLIPGAIFDDLEGLVDEVASRLADRTESEEGGHV